MKVIFLDIDGVLNSAQYFSSQLWKEREAKIVALFNDEAGPGFQFKDHYLKTDPEAVARLNRLVWETGAKVVVSSVWRKNQSPAQLQEVLEAAGARCEVIGKTCSLNKNAWAESDRYAVQRGDEIKKYLDEHPEITEYVVLDDDDDMDAVRAHFVYTDWEDGLLDAHVQRAIGVLNGKLYPVHPASAALAK